MKKFSVSKTLQVLSYIQQKSGCTDMLSLLKLCFFADRKMLRTFGIPILDDKYFALKYGPVCSQTKNILLQDFDFLYVTKADEELIKSNVTIEGAHDMKIASLKDSSLSKAEKQVLDFVTDTFGKFSSHELVDITHDYPEWKRWEKNLSASNQSEPMDYEDFFKNPVETPALDKYFDSKDPFEESSENLEIAKAMYLQNYAAQF